jgi:hypothetical protein
MTVLIAGVCGDSDLSENSQIPVLEWAKFRGSPISTVSVNVRHCQEFALVIVGDLWSPLGEQVFLFTERIQWKPIFG